MDFVLSPECQHSKNGLCSKCVLNQSFSISAAEEMVRKNHSGPCLVEKSNDLSSKSDEITRFESFPSLPVKTIQPQSDVEIPVTDSYTSFADLDRFSNVQIQEENNRDHEYLTTPLVEPCSLLMRLFKSDLFTPFIAIRYLFSCSDIDVRIYLGSKLFGFSSEDVDFYIPQLINMYITDKEIAAALHPYFVTRCQESAHFSLLCVWLLESFGVDVLRISDKNLAQGELLRQMIINNFETPKPLHSLPKMSMLGDRPRTVVSGSVLNAETLSSGLHLTRSESASASLRYMTSASPGGSLDNGCRCFDTPRTEKCTCGADRLSAEHEFISWLTTIGNRLTEEPSKGEKTRRLVTELIRMNMSLPARVWVPFSFDHIVLRIPPTNSCVLNSKDKAPYCIYVEVLRCDDAAKVPIPRNLTDAESELHLRLRSASIASLYDTSTHSAPDPSTEETSESGVEIEVVECHDVNDSIDVFPDYPAPEQAWDSMSLQSSSSEPVMRNGRLQTAEISRRLKHWVNNKRPGRQRQMRPHPDDPSASTMSEPWEEKRERIRQASPYGRLPGWDLLPVIVKSGDDLAQELLAYQLLVTLKAIWDEEQVALFLRPYKILVTSPSSGMIEPIVDACSLHQIKRNQAAVFQEEGQTGVPSLELHFLESYGPKGTGTYLRAQQNFVQSCAAYSLVCYFLQLKDRHNGNILLDADGHLIHIDFGFILSVSPKNLGFETSPFKLTSEMINVMGGVDSDLFLYFKTLLLKGLIAARKHHERIMTLVEITYKGSSLPCFRGGVAALKAMQDRFHMTFTDSQLENLVNTMVVQSLDSLTTRLYDNFQYYTNGIL